MVQTLKSRKIPVNTILFIAFIYQLYNIYLQTVVTLLVESNFSNHIGELKKIAAEHPITLLMRNYDGKIINR